MRLVFIFGLGSRYSYLAATQLPKLEREFSVTFDWWPVHSPDLIAASRQGPSPFAASQSFGQYSEAYRDQDVRRWAAHYNEPYNPPVEGAPTDRVLAETCWATASADDRRKVAERMLNAIFVRGVSDVLADLSIPGSRNGADQHDAALSHALRLGAFGVPSFVVGTEIFWGNDRLVLVRDSLTRQA